MPKSIFNFSIEPKDTDERKSVFGKIQVVNYPEEGVFMVNFYCSSLLSRVQFRQFEESLHVIWCPHKDNPTIVMLDTGNPFDPQREEHIRLRHQSEQETTHTHTHQVFKYRIQPEQLKVFLESGLRAQSNRAVIDPIAEELGVEPELLWMLDGESFDALCSQYTEHYKAFIQQQFFNACMAGDYDTVKELAKDKYVNIHAIDEKGRNTLHFAVMRPSLSKRLLEKVGAADVDFREEAILKGRKKILNFLIRKGVSLEQKNIRGNTPRALLERDSSSKQSKQDAQTQVSEDCERETDESYARMLNKKLARTERVLSEKSASTSVSVETLVRLSAVTTSEVESKKISQAADSGSTQETHSQRKAQTNKA